MIRAVSLETLEWVGVVFGVPGGLVGVSDNKQNGGRSHKGGNQGKQTHVRHDGNRRHTSFDVEEETKGRPKGSRRQ